MGRPRQGHGRRGGTSSVICSFRFLLEICDGVTVSCTRCQRRDSNTLLGKYLQYAKVAHYNTTHIRRQSFYALPKEHWELLAAPPFSYLDTLNAVDDAIDKNAELATSIVNSGLKSFGFPLIGSPVEVSPQWRGKATASDLDKARSTLCQFYRDWSSEGARERRECLDPIIRDLQVERGNPDTDVMNVLVPGAGLGRLVFELCKDGFNVEGNEISYHQLLASSYILNYCLGQGVHTIYPWVHSFSNHSSRSHHLKSVQVPDVHPATSLKLARQDNNTNYASDMAPYRRRQPGEMSMSAADFLCVYSAKEYKDAFDAVATVFFIDTAPNPIHYIETVRNCLRPGGIWANLGPLLWHFKSNPPGKHSHGYRYVSSLDGDKEPRGTCISDPGCVELTHDELEALLSRFGFKFEKIEYGLPVGYIQNPDSMLQSTYRVSHWVARKL